MIEDMSRSQDVTEEICATLRAAIFEGALRPGDKLKEDILSLHFKTSRTVVRGALSMLVQQHLAERRRNHGTFVAAPQPEEARNLLATRRVLEIAVMQALPRKIAAAQITALHQAIARERHVHAGTDAQQIKKISGDFHFLLTDFTGNTVLRSLLENILTRLSLVNALYEKSSGCSCGTSHHEVIVKHLERGDFDAASQAMSKHLDEIEGDIIFDAREDNGDQFLAILERMRHRS